MLLDALLLQHLGDGVRQRHIAAGDGRGAGAAIGLYDIAVNHYGVFPQGLQVCPGAQGAPYQALDLVGAPALPTLGGLAARAFVGRARQHAIFGGHPALASALQKRRHGVLEAGGAQHLGAAKLHQD